MPMQKGGDLQLMLGFRTQYQQFSREAEKFSCVHPLNHTQYQQFSRKYVGAGSKGGRRTIF